MADKLQLPITTIIDPDNLNLAEYMEDDELTALGAKLRQAFDLDVQSRASWEDDVDSWMKLAIQYKEDKSFPWPKAANIKYPLLTTAAMQFSARAYPSLIVNKKPVKARIIGKETPELTSISERISQHMSYQLLEDMDNWEDDMDKMFMILPIVGLAYKKTYFNSATNKNCSELVLPRDLVVNYWAKKLGGFTRKHHIIEMLPNDLYTRKELGQFLDVELDEPKSDEFNRAPQKDNLVNLTIPSEDDETTPYRIVECHCHYDLDGDGYLEPYIMTFDTASSTILRIAPRFREESIRWSDTATQQKKIISIEPDEYFTKYGFIPNPDGSFYDLGFGLLLGPINETINTSINQLLDQGTMYTTNGGFLGKGVRIKAGEYRFAPNEWKVINATVDDLRKSIYQLPVREPSQVLFQMLGSLIEGGEKVASIAEIFVGKMPGQNTPATTTMETVKQGMAVFTAIYKRVYRSLDSEFKKLFKLNQLYLDDHVDYPVDLTKAEYQNIKLTVVPTADPDVATDAEKLIKAKAQMEFIQYGTVDPKVVTRNVLEALRIEGIDELLNFQPPPSPEQQKLQGEMQLKQVDSQRKDQESKAKQGLLVLQGKIKMMESGLKAQGVKQDAFFKALEAKLGLQIQAAEAQADRQERAHDSAADALESHQERKNDMIDFMEDQRRTEQSHIQKIRHTEEQAQVAKKVALMKAKSAEKAKPKKKT